MKLEAENLIVNAKNGDEQALTELFKAYKDQLLESIRVELGEKLRQRLESQDIMQQVYIDALTYINHFEQNREEGIEGREGRGDPFFAWLKKIAINRICDVDRQAFRTQKRGGEVRSADLNLDASINMLFGEIGGSMTSPSGVVNRSERVEKLKDAMARLSEEHRLVLELRYFNQLNVAETAAKMEKTERAVRSMCVRAIIRLRDLLGDAV